MFAFPKIGHNGCVAKITVTWRSLHFEYKIEWLTTVEDAWTKIGKAITENTQRNPTLPEPDEFNPSILVSLSPNDLLEFGRNARQLACMHHVMVECNDKIYKPRGFSLRNIAGVRSRGVIKRAYYASTYF